MRERERRMSTRFRSRQTPRSDRSVGTNRPRITRRTCWTRRAHLVGLLGTWGALACRGFVSANATGIMVERDVTELVRDTMR
jgi:hypothetical protein